MKSIRALISVLSAICLLPPELAASEMRADTVYHNGTIITMNDEQPMAEAVAVQGGRILAVGDTDQILSLAGDATRRVDLQGRALLPGFVDSHGHANMIGLQASTANLLPAPDGEGNDIASLQRLLSDWAELKPEPIAQIGWIIGFGYDDSQLAEQRHPTRHDLDAVSTEVPIIIIHQSSHLGVANSKALELAGITAETPDPEGGVFRREADSNQPSGVMEEYAFFQVMFEVAGQFDQAINETLIEQGTKLAASFGYTTVQEGRASPEGILAMQAVAERDALDVDLVAYPDILLVEDIQPSMTYNNGFRVGGAKLTIDGSPQGKTAFLTEPYHVVPEGMPEDYRGYAAINAEVVTSLVERAFANGWQILCHANGDAAIDQYIDAVRAAQQAHPDVDNRPVLIHGQVLREDQVAELQELGIFASLFPMHTYYWGDWHRESVLGPERADNISPTGWLIERGMIFGSHHDAPVALPNSMRVLSATVTRRSRSGDILGPEHRVSVITALKAMTLWPAWQHFEETEKGSLEPGKLADFVILSDNPLAVEESELAELKVLETIKEDQTIYLRDEAVATRAQPAVFGLVREEHNNRVHRSFAPHLRGDGCFNSGLSLLYHALQGHSAPNR